MTNTAPAQSITPSVPQTSAPTGTIYTDLYYTLINTNQEPVPDVVMNISVSSTSGAGGQFLVGNTQSLFLTNSVDNDSGLASRLAALEQLTQPITSVNVLTNAQGVAKVPPFQSNNITGTFKLVAFVTNFPAPAAITITNTAPIPCLHPDTMVKTTQGMKRISEIRKGDVVYDSENNEVRVLFNMEFQSTDRLMKIMKNALGPNTPVRDLRISKDHPIMYNGEKIAPKKLAKKIDGVITLKLSKAVKIWSLCTMSGEYVMMEGVPVATWAITDVSSTKFNYKYKSC